MRPIIFAGVLAIGIHALLFGMEFDCFKKKHVYRPETSAVTMTLTYLQPRVIQPKSDVKKSHAVSIVSPKSQKKPLISKKMLRAPVRPEKVIFEESELQKRAHSPLLAAGLASESKNSKLPYGRRFPAACGGELQTQEEIVADIDLAVAVDIKNKTSVMKEAAPLYKINPLPKYPRLARKRGYQGTVVLDVLVDQNGRVGDLRLFTSSGYSILDRKAMASVKGWLFEPGMKGDKKLDMWVRVPVRFQLK